MADDEDDWKGEPEIRVRAKALELEFNFPYYGAINAQLIADIQPLHRGPYARWLAVTAKGTLLTINSGSNFVEPSPPLEAPVDFTSALTMNISPDERWLALANTYGPAGCVINLETRKTVLKLKRGDYHIEHCRFPLAFFEKDGRSLLIHGTDWDRLDVCDPATGELLTKREFPIVPKGEDVPHALDYFHGRLDVSPGAEFVLDNGWVWHPVGLPVVFSLKDWLETNVWESEDGPSRRDLAMREYYWPSPAAWIDSHTLALTGLHDHHLPANGARIIDARSGEVLSSFAGPSGELFFDEYLFASDSDGFTAWDVKTGERVLQEPTFQPVRYNRTSKEFISLLPGNGLRVARLAGTPPALDAKKNTA